MHAKFHIPHLFDILQMDDKNDILYQSLTCNDKICPGGSSCHTLLGVGNKYVFFTTASQLHKITLECLQSLSKREIHKINALPTQMFITNAGVVALKQ